MPSLAVPSRRLQLIAQHLSRPSARLAASPSFSSLNSSSSRSHSSSSTSSTASKYPYTFTTSFSFHGKPPYRPRRGSSPPHLSQGLPDSHPLVAWREQVLQEGGAPKPQGAGHDFAFVEGVRRGEEDGLEEGEEGVRAVVLGVADGVGGWEDQFQKGVDPSHFSQALMFFARERVRLSTSSSSSSSSSISAATGKAPTAWSWPAEPAKRSGAKLRDLLQGAFDDVKKEEGIVAGSSTACLVALDAETGQLHAANLGDSSFLVFRPTAALPSSPSSSDSSDPPSPPSSPSDPPSPTTLYTLLHSQPPQIHFFNAPYQLSKFPPHESTENALLNYPRDADVVSSLQLEDGDVVMLVTDGFSDNVFDEGEANVLVTAVRQKLETYFAGKAKEDGGEGIAEVSRAERDKELASSVARTAVSFARMISVREDKVTPFEVEARRWSAGGKGGFKGGKVDDVTVVVAVVRKEGGGRRSEAGKGV
ncbi:hypothetical protein JCM8547_005516 [Rhodosporidiobolus lusitaniae]